MAELTVQTTLATLRVYERAGLARAEMMAIGSCRRELLNHRSLQRFSQFEDNGCSLTRAVHKPPQLIPGKN